MPTYQYACTNAECGTRFELVQSFTDPAASECPTCNGPVRKVFSAVGVVFKGSGFYRTDSRSDSHGSNGKSHASSSNSSSESSSGSSGDSSSSSSSNGSTDSASSGSSGSSSSGSSSSGSSSSGSSSQTKAAAPA